MGALRIGAIVGAVVGVVLAGVLGWVVLPKVIDDRIKEEVRLINGTETWDKWADIELPIQFKFYIFHVTNADSVEGGAVPILEERGPYVYDEKRTKEDLEVDGDIISYRQPIVYTFNREASVGDEFEDKVDIINIPYLSVIHKFRDSPVIVNILNTYLRIWGARVIKKDVFVGDLTFNGMDVRHYLPLNFTGALPEEFSGGRFGLYKGNNGTDDGLYEIYSGVEDHTKFGEIKSWDGKTSMGYWNGTDSPYCDMINGTDGSIYPPFVDKNRILRVFVVDLCRSLFLTYKEKTEVFGIKAFRFSVPREALAGPEENEDNACFCLYDDPETCFSGALDVEVCRGAPIIFSAPYFLDGDSRHADNISILVDRELQKMTATRELHETVMDLEPNSGVLLNANKRLQVNMRLQRFSNIEGFRFVLDNTFPLVWIDETAGVDEANAQDLKDKLLKPMKIIDIAKYTVLGVGIVIAILGAIVAWKAA